MSNKYELKKIIDPKGNITNRIWESKFKIYCDVFPGDFLFMLKDTYGFPLDFALDKIINEHKLCVDWVGFIEEARKHGWREYQIHEVVQHAVVDAMLEKDTAEGIMFGLMLYICKTTPSYSHCLIQGDI